MTKQSSCHKGEKKAIFVATKPGKYVSVDQMESTQLGFVAQAKGKLTIKRYHYSTVFVDHLSRLRYVHFMERLTGVETLAAKRAFESYAAEHGVRISHYHCDNGRFAKKLFMNSCELNGEQFTFCGVNAHFQNGIAEKSIQDITEAGRKMLLHAKMRWPRAIDLSLWPYAVSQACHIHNN